MALWGNNDNKGSGGTVSLNYSTLVVTGSGTTFGQVGAAATGDVIRFGFRGSNGTYFGDAVIVGIASTTQLSIASTAGLSGAAIASTSFYISELPKYTVLDSTFSEASYGVNDKQVYGISTSSEYVPAAYRGFTHQGWVGVTTYTDMHGNVRVKSEVLVAMSGITTGTDGIIYPTPKK
jgi:hypothetical protein